MQTHVTQMLLGVSLILGSALGCATAPGSTAPRYEFFASADPGRDPWYRKVESWQARARQDHIPAVAALRQPDDAAPHVTGLLRIKMGDFETKQKVQLARRINEWSQIQGRTHYRLEVGLDADAEHWPTLKELLEANGDDCDGLDLIAYQLLTEFGFPEDDVYRAVIRRDRDRQNHMVTFWFEDPTDPWVLDATAAVTRKMRKFSELPGWTPTAVFNERSQFGVVKRRPGFAQAGD